MKKSALALSILFTLLAGPLGASAQNTPVPVPAALQGKIIDVGQRLLSTNGIKDPISFLYNPYPAQAYPAPGAMPGAMAAYPGGMGFDPQQMAAAYAASMGMAMPGMAPTAITQQVTVTPDLLNVLSNEDELAAVLAHEIAHIERNPMQEMQKSAKRKATSHAIMGTAFSALSSAASMAGAFAGPVGMIGSQAIGAAQGLAYRGGGSGMPQMRPPDEQEMDALALQYMVKAGYNPLAMETLFRKAAVSNNAPMPAFFMTHQVGSARVIAIHDSLQKKYPKFLTAAVTTPPAPSATLAAPNPPATNTTPIAPATVAVPTKTEAINAIAQVEIAPANPLLQSLKPDESLALKLINEKGYLSRADLGKQVNATVADTLLGKKLLRVVGNQPNDGFVLTDTAADALNTGTGTH